MRTERQILNRINRVADQRRHVYMEMARTPMRAHRREREIRDLDLEIERLYGDLRRVRLVGTSWPGRQQRVSPQSVLDRLREGRLRRPGALGYLQRRGAA